MKCFLTFLACLAISGAAVAPAESEVPSLPERFDLQCIVPAELNPNAALFGHHRLHVDLKAMKVRDHMVTYQIVERTPSQLRFGTEFHSVYELVDPDLRSHGVSQGWTVDLNSWAAMFQDDLGAPSGMKEAQCTLGPWTDADF